MAGDQSCRDGEKPERGVSMSNHWWRAYDEAVDDPKLQRLAPPLFKSWFNLCCLASANGGALPPIGDVAFKLHVSEHKAAEVITALVAAGLIDRNGDTFEPHNWKGRQYRSDVTDATAAERMKRYRKKRNAVTAETVTPAVTVTAPRVQSTDTERKEEDAPDGAPAKYEFESGVIRLNKRDFDRWKASFSNLDLRAELIGLTQWAADQRDWFFAISGALAKRNREMSVRLVGARAAAVGAGRAVTPSGNPWPEGIT